VTPIEESLLAFFTFPDESKYMARTRSAGVEVYDQINKVKQSLYVSNNSSHVIHISMNGMLFFDVAISKWKVVNQFKGEINFSYDA
jgi:predicted secreted protein